MQNRFIGLLSLGLITFGTNLITAHAVEPDLQVRKSSLSEEAALSPYGAPEWTEARRFPTTRVYLQQSPGDMAVEQWIRSKFYDGERGKHRIQQEFEVGLPRRMQLDLSHDVHVDVVPLFGLSDDAPDLTTYFVIGYDFGSKRESGVNPISTKGR